MYHFLCLIVAVPSVLLPQILITEVDTDTSGIDRGEFIELYNSGSDTVDLAVASYALVIFDGQDQRVINDPIFLQGEIAAGEYWVLGGTQVSNRTQTQSMLNFMPNSLGAVALVYGLEEDAVQDDFSPSILLEESTLVDAVVYGERQLNLSVLESTLGTIGRPFELSGLSGELYSIQKHDLAAGAFDWSSALALPPTPGQQALLVSEPILVANLTELRKLTNPQLVRIEALSQVVSPGGALGVPSSETVLGSVFVNDAQSGIQLENLPIDQAVNFPLGRLIESLQGTYSGVDSPRLVEVQESVFSGDSAVMPLNLNEVPNWQPNTLEQRLVSLSNVRFLNPGIALQAGENYSLIDQNGSPVPLLFSFSAPLFNQQQSTPSGAFTIQGIVFKKETIYTIEPRFQEDLLGEDSGSVWLAK
ncbi:MAG: lamin tail domain-containing protein [Sumerlaeia bacterium]